jgi:hypothetical protein
MSRFAASGRKARMVACSNLDRDHVVLRCFGPGPGEGRHCGLLNASRPGGCAATKRGGVDNTAWVFGFVCESDADKGRAGTITGPVPQRNERSRCWDTGRIPAPSTPHAASQTDARASSCATRTGKRWRMSHGGEPADRRPSSPREIHFAYVRKVVIRAFRRKPRRHELDFKIDIGKEFSFLSL